jgi:predicted amidohydrolase
VKIAILQTRPVFGEVSRNLHRIEALCPPGVDLAILPELCATGYQFQSAREARSLAEPADGATVRFLAALARKRGCAFVFGFAERDGQRLFNSAALVGPRGLLGLYRKVHLFEREKDFFRPGDLGFRVFSVGRVRVGLMICFDWIFPEAARTLALAGADLIAHPANLVLPWCQRAMVTRALENRVFCATANRVGIESRWRNHTLRFTGGSRIVSPTGEVLAEGPRTREGVLVADIRPGLARDKRVTSRCDLFADRRPDLYHPSWRD